MCNYNCCLTPPYVCIFIADVDECAHSALRQCSLWADCNNTVGSYECVCHQGYIDVDPSNPGAHCSGLTAHLCVCLQCRRNPLKSGLWDNCQIIKMFICTWLCSILLCAPICAIYLGFSETSSHLTYTCTMYVHRESNHIAKYNIWTSSESVLFLKCFQLPYPQNPLSPFFCTRKCSISDKYYSLDSAVTLEVTRGISPSESPK